MTDLERSFGMAATWIAPATLVGALIVGLAIGLGPAFLVLAGGILLGAVMLLWSSLGRLTGESPLTLDEAIGLAAPSAEEERKRSVLRALKDLDYERSVGKISEEDYADLSARYRTEAKALLRALETGLAPRRKTAEERLGQRLKAAGLGERKSSSTPPPVEGGPAPAVDAAAAPTAEAAPSAKALECAKCRTSNDGDATFCKRCGARLVSEEAP